MIGKNVILLTIDCLRQDHLKLYGYKRDITPNIDKLAKNALTFNNMIVNGSNTPSSFYSLFTSSIPTLDGKYAPLPTHKKVFSEILQQKGIKTCGIHSNPHLGTYCNYERGFDYYVDVLEKPHFNLKKKLLTLLRNILVKTGFKRKFRRLLKFASKYVDLKKEFASIQTSKSNAPYSNAKIIIAEAIDWLNKNFETPFFMWIHFMDVHRPYYPPESYINKITNLSISDSMKLYLNKLFDNYKKDPDFYKKVTSEHIEVLNILYDAEIMFVDHYIGIFFSYLKKKGIYDNSNIIISADHGQALFDHNQLSHGVSLYDELLRVPFVFKLGLPGGAINGQLKRIPDIVEFIDLAPTILELFGLSNDEAFKGKSIMHLIEDKQHSKHLEEVISAIYHSEGRMFTAFSNFRSNPYLLMSVRDKNWKLIYNEENKKIELYNLKKDPQELNDLSESRIYEINYIKNTLFEKIRNYVLDKDKLRVLLNNDSFNHQ
jgi:arylsulfatase A-like enzyme